MPTLMALRLDWTDAYWHRIVPSSNRITSNEFGNEPLPVFCTSRNWMTARCASDWKKACDAPWNTRLPQKAAMRFSGAPVALLGNPVEPAPLFVLVLVNEMKPFVQTRNVLNDCP